uniref:Uncharacterized protein n=1 Tax=Clastoptera arizonana TaxID=38151 RepID=A0A1B6D861_9HEMI
MKMVFFKDKSDIGTEREYEAHIDTTVNKHCSKRPYRCSIEDKKEIEIQLTKLLEKNLFEYLYSPLAASVKLVLQDEGKRTRLCVGLNFRELNKIVIPQYCLVYLVFNIFVK